MTPELFLTYIEKHKPNLPPSEILSHIDYKFNGETEWEYSGDLNDSFREEVTELLFKNYTSEHYQIIRYLLEAEKTYCAEHTMSREAIHQMAFMLVDIGDIEDTPLLYEIKFKTSFDLGCSFDIQLIFGKNLQQTKAYFSINPHPSYDIVKTIEEYEKGMKDYNWEEYAKDIRAYHS